MKVLVACEFSGVVRDAFIAAGHDAWSCDLLPCDRGGHHIRCDVAGILGGCGEPFFKWDMMIAFPPCTHLAVSGARWFKDKQKEQQEAIEFFIRLANAPIPYIAIENPVGIMSRHYRKPDQIVQPWMFGHEATKTTCLWLKNLPPLKPTKIVSKGERHITKSGRSLPKWYNIPPREDRWKLRSATFSGLAQAMATQWSVLPQPELLLPI